MCIKYKVLYYTVLYHNAIPMRSVKRNEEMDIIYAIENVFLCLHSLIQTPEGLGEFETVMQPEMKWECLHNYHNSPNALSVYIRLCKHRKKVFYCFYKITFPGKNAKLFVWH